MSPHAEGARRQAYHLLSDLYLRGIASEDLPLLRDVPELARHLPDPFDADEAAAERHRLVSREVLPYASVFLEADGVLGGDVSAAVERRFRSVGLQVPSSEPADHLGRELELLAALERARPEGGPGEGEEDAVLGFLDGHLLWWLPPLVPALRRHADAFWRTVADLTLELVLDHRRTLAGDAPPTHPPPWNLQGLPRDPLDDPTVDLREVATFLMLPARSGVYLGEADARALGRSRRLPGGFGGRVRILETVFHSAVAYGAMEDVADGLGALVADVRDTFETMAERGLPADFVAPWLRRMEQTAGMLARMRRGEGPLA